MLFCFKANLFFKNLFEIRSDDENDLFNTCPPGIIKRVINDNFAVGANRINLLQAAVATANARCHNYHCQLAHNPTS